MVLMSNRATELKLLRDEDLVVIYREGDDRAFEELYSRYARRIKKIIYYYTYNRDEIEDVFHDVFLKVLKHAGSFDTKKAFSSWIYQIAINCCKNSIHKYKKNDLLVEREKFRLMRQDTDAPSPEERLISDFDREEFNRAVLALGDKFRDVFMLRYDHNLKYHEIAEILDCSERTVKWRMKKAIESIAIYLKEREVL